MEVFRAFAEKSYRRRAQNQVRYLAYLLREEDIQDGLSVGLTPRGAVRHLNSNEGFCRILVGTIHGLPYGLEVRADPNDGEHAFIFNLPLGTISDAELERARLIAGALARASQIVTCDPYIP